MYCLLYISHIETWNICNLTRLHFSIFCSIVLNSKYFFLPLFVSSLKDVWCLLRFLPSVSLPLKLKLPIRIDNWIENWANIKIKIVRDLLWFERTRGKLNWISCSSLLPLLTTRRTLTLRNSVLVFRCGYINEPWVFSGCQVKLITAILISKHIIRQRVGIRHSFPALSAQPKCSFHPTCFNSITGLPNSTH